MDRIHCLVIKELETGKVFNCHNQPNAELTVKAGVDILNEGERIVGHNIVGFDIPAIQMIHPEFKPKGIVRDTLTMSRLIYIDMLDKDFKRDKKLKGQWIAKYLFGRHSLESWGQRLGLWKGDYGQIRKDEGKEKGLEGQDLVDYVWGTWSQGMQDYCVQDVEVTEQLYNKLNSKGFSEDSIQLEHDVQRIINRQEAYGFQLDDKAAVSLYGVLAQEKQSLEEELTKVFPAWYRKKEFKRPLMDRSVSQKQFKPIGFETYKKTGEPKFDKNGERKWIYPKAHYVADAPYTKVELLSFNAGSRQDIADRLVRVLGWKPTEFTDDGHPKVDEETLKLLPWPEAKTLRRYLLIQKRIGQLAEGKEAWLKRVGPDGRLHGRVNTLGAVTSRMTHTTPNMAQVPSGGAPFGHECRALFVVGAGKKLVGCDADALELRDLAGYMAAYDKGAYIKTVLEGKKEEGTDMHTLNAQALGCTRDVAKVWFYAFIYGAGDEKLGSILGIEGDKATLVNAGKKSRAKFLKALPALKKLVTRVKKKASLTKTLKGLDGRILPVRSAHASLNTLLQSAGAIQMKRGLVILDDNLQEKGLIPGVHYEFVANIHDEWQIEVDEDKAELVGRTAADAIRLAGEYYGFRCPLAGNYDIGNNWAETH